MSTGIITTIAGTGSSTGSYNGDSGQATSVGLCDPSGVALDSSGIFLYEHIYIYAHNLYTLRQLVHR